MPKYSNKVIDRTNSAYIDIGECIRVWIHYPLQDENDMKCLTIVVWCHGSHIIMKDFYSVDELFNQEMLMHFGDNAYDFVKELRKHEIIRRFNKEN